MSPLCPHESHLITSSLPQPESRIMRQLPIAMVREATSFDFFCYQEAKEIFARLLALNLCDLRDVGF